MRTTDIDRERELTARIAGIYRTAVLLKMTSGAAHRSYTEQILNSPDFKRLPDYRKHAVRAIYYHLFHGPADLSIYQHLEYRMLWTDGLYYANFDAWREQFPDGDASLIRDGAHFWKGTDRPYFGVNEVAK